MQETLNDNDAASQVTSSSGPTSTRLQRTQSTKPLQCITFDRDGDLQLVVGRNEGQQDMVVDSRALCRGSPVFRKMLSGSFKEAKPRNGDDWVVKLPYDKSEAMIILCDLCHGQSERTPMSPSILTLYNVAVVADKYDMVRCLRPVAFRWLKVCGRTSKLNTFEDKTLLLCAAWYLGDASLVRCLAGDISKHVQFNQQGEPYFGSWRMVDDVRLNHIDVLGKLFLLAYSNNHLSNQ